MRKKIIYIYIQEIIFFYKKPKKVISRHNCRYSKNTKLKKKKKTQSITRCQLNQKTNSKIKLEYYPKKFHQHHKHHNPTHMKKAKIIIKKRERRIQIGEPVNKKKNQTCYLPIKSSNYELNFIDQAQNQHRFH